MSKFNKHAKTGKLIHRPELKRQSSIPFSEFKSFNIQQKVNKPANLKDTVKLIIEQIREEKKQQLNNKDDLKSFKDVVHKMMKNKSRVYNENVLKLAKSVVINNQQLPTTKEETPPPPPIEYSNDDILLNKYANKDTFHEINPMTLTISVKQPNKIRFGSAINTDHEIINKILKQ